MSAKRISRYSNRECIVERWIDAPQLRLYEAFTTPDQVDRWWGLSGFTSRTTEMNVDVGGFWRYSVSGDGGVFLNRLQFTRVDAPKCLEYDHGTEDAGPKPHFSTTITFREQKGGTLVTLRMRFPTPLAMAFVMSNFNAANEAELSLTRLEDYLAEEMRAG
jgi:uncharacterized protein YndB with AHSA1/START domain